MQKLATVLLVDDDITTNFLNERLLTRLEMVEQVLVAPNGVEALGILTHLWETAPDQRVLVLLDVNMPVMDGMEFLEAYQRLPLNRQQQAVVVVLTTSMNSKDLGRLDDLPIAGLASKPLTREKVNTLLQLHFQRQLPGS